MSTTTGGGPKNFVARLVDLASGSAAVGMPRLPSLFEPTSSRTHPRAQGVAGAEGPDQILSTDTRTAKEDSSEAVVDSFDSTPRDGKRDAPRQESGVRPFYATPQLHTVHARNDNPGVALAPVDPPAADRQRRDAGPPPRERIVTDRSAAVPRPVETQRDLTPAHHDNAPVTDRPAGALKHPPVVTRHRTDNAPATDEKPKQQGALNSGHLPVLVPADSQRRAHESESARLGAARAESVVHVSIGRVEVRASLPATPPSRTKQRSPMSLEDYLRQRSGAR